MPNVQPIQQPVIEDIRTAAAIANLWALADGMEPSPLRHAGEAIAAFAQIDRLLRHALTELSEPNLAAMQAGEILLTEWSGTPEPERQLRDTIAGIIAAQISGIVPKTWEVS